MEKQSVRLLCFASILLTLWSCSTEDPWRPALEQSDLTKPDAVVAVLKAGVSKTAKARAELFFAEGIEMREQATKGKRSWGPVVKSFGASAMFYPRPLALMGDAEASLRDIRPYPSAKHLQLKHNILKGALDKYKSALAADDILQELNSVQRTELNHYLQCTMR